MLKELGNVQRLVEIEIRHEQSDGPKRWIDRSLIENLPATAAVIGVVLPTRRIAIRNSNEMRSTLLACLAFSVCAATCCIVKSQEPASSTDAVPPSGITVAFSGPLYVMTTLKPDIDPARLFLDVAAQDLKMATVDSGGTTVHLDWSRSDKLRDELIAPSSWFGDGGPNSKVHATVTGRMVFKPSKELAYRVISAGVTDATPVPVVIVESIKIQFVRSDGKPFGPARKLVTAD